MRIGHVHLKVRSLETSVDFYASVLGFTVSERIDGFAFLSGGPGHHELALQEIGMNAHSPDPRAVGLYHVAYEVSDGQELARVWGRLKSLGISVTAVDHRISWALYFSDPDGHGVEIYLDTRNQPGGAALWRGESRALTGPMIEGGPVG